MGHGASRAPLCKVLLLVVVVDAGAAYLERQSLDSLADGSAPYGADAAAVHDYRRSAGAYDAHPGLRASVTVRDDQVVVEIAAPVDLPLALPGGPARPMVRATGSAVVRPE